jgi:2-methylfumaryl-CoA hydratase
MTKNNSGWFFEDFRLNQKLVHATPRTLSEADQTLYTALYGSRFALQASNTFAESTGLPRAPLDDLLVFHTVFGKSVPDISLNAVANLGYAEGHFYKHVFPGATIGAHSDVIGLKENSSGETGVVYVRTTGTDQKDERVLSYVRWVMVRKRDPGARTPEEHIPSLAPSVPVSDLRLPPHLNFDTLFDPALSGSSDLWNHYEPGERIDHVDGMTIEEADHMLATRLYQNTARVHFNQFAEAKGRFGKRLVYGGHVISIARALSFNGLANAMTLAAINGGRHVNPVFAGDTVFAWSEVIEKAAINHRKDLGALRLRLVATKNLPCKDFPDKNAGGAYADSVVLDFDYWAILPKN